MVKLLESNNSRITKYKEGENFPNLEITEITEVLVQCNIANDTKK